MTRRLRALVLASLLLLSSVSAFALIGECNEGCFCYYATWSGGSCGTISRDGCYVLQCIQYN